MAYYFAPTTFGLDSGTINGDDAYRAACRPGTGVDPEIFFPVGDLAILTARALAVCDRCPVKVKQACLRWAVEHHVVDGIWGGVEQTELRIMVAARIQAERDARPTPAGCMRCHGEDVELDGRGLCATCYTIAHRGRYLSKFPVLTGEPGAADMDPETHCRWSHPWNAGNTYFDTKGAKQCRRCKQERKAVRKRQLRAEAAMPS